MSAANRGSDWWGTSSAIVKVMCDHDVDDGGEDDDDDDDEVGSPGGGPAQTRLPQSR